MMDAATRQRGKLHSVELKLLGIAWLGRDRKGNVEFSEQFRESGGY